MAISFFIDFKGPVVELERANLQINKGALRPAFRRMIADYRRIMAETYASQRTPGYRWPPNSPTYIRDDRYKGANPPGVRTGANRRAHVQGKGPGAVEQITDRGFVVGSSLRYGNFSAAGPRRPRGRSGPVLDTFTQTFDRSRQRRGVRDRRVPVRDPLLALYTPATRAIRKRIRERWQGYILDEMEGIITDQTSLRIARPRRSRRRRR